MCSPKEYHQKFFAEMVCPRHGEATPRFWTPTTPPTNCWPEAPCGGGRGGGGGGGGALEGGVMEGEWGGGGLWEGRLGGGSKWGNSGWWWGGGGSKWGD